MKKIMFNDRSGMTELELYKYLQEVEVKITYKDVEKEDFEELTDDNWEDWKAYIFPFHYQLQQFTEMVGSSYFDSHEMQIILKNGFVVIDIMPIIEYFDFHPRHLF